MTDGGYNQFCPVAMAAEVLGGRWSLVLLRELVAWRNEVARKADRATFRVLGNEPLLEVARLKPSTREALAGIKGMPAAGVPAALAAPIAREQ